MSEKRFEVNIYTLPTTIQDNNTKKTYSSMRSVVDLLNSLSDENEELKIENEFLKMENEEHKALIEKRWGEYMQKKFKENEE